MEEILTAYLLAAAGLTALVGDRITWATRQQSTPLPAAVLTVISTVTDYANDGPTGLRVSRLQVDCWGASYASAKAVARQVGAKISGLRHEAAGITLTGGFAQGERDSFETGAAEERLYRTSLDFLIWTG